MMAASAIRSRWNTALCIGSRPSDRHRRIVMFGCTTPFGGHNLEDDTAAAVIDVATLIRHAWDVMARPCSRARDSTVAKLASRAAVGCTTLTERAEHDRGA